MPDNPQRQQHHEDASRDQQRGAPALRMSRLLRLVLGLNHVALTCILGSFAFTLALPGNTLSNPNWSAFSAIMPETQWALAFTVGACVGVIGLVTTSRWVLLASSIGIATTHVCIAWLFYLGSETRIYGWSTGTGTYSIVAALGYSLCFVRVVARV